MARAHAIEIRLEKLIPHTEELLIVGCYSKDELQQIHRERTFHEYRLVARPLLLNDVLAAIDFEMKIERRIAAFCANRHGEVKAAMERDGLVSDTEGAEARRVAGKIRLNHRWAVQDRITQIYRIGLKHLSRKAVRINCKSIESFQRQLFYGTVDDSYGLSASEESARATSAATSMSLYSNDEYLSRLLCPSQWWVNSAFTNEKHANDDIICSLQRFSKLRSFARGSNTSSVSVHGGIVVMSPFEILRRQCVYHLHIVFKREVSISRLYADWLQHNINTSSDALTPAGASVNRALLWAEAALYEAIGCHRFEEGRALLLQAMQSMLPSWAGDQNSFSNAAQKVTTRAVFSPTDERVTMVLIGAALLLEVVMAKHLLVEAANEAVRHRDKDPVSSIEAEKMGPVVLDLALPEAVVSHAAMLHTAPGKKRKNTRGDDKTTSNDAENPMSKLTLLTPAVGVFLFELLEPLQFVRDLRVGIVEKTCAATMAVLSSCSSSVEASALTKEFPRLLYLLFTADMFMQRANTVDARTFITDRVRCEIKLLEESDAAGKERNPENEAQITDFRRKLRKISALEQKEALASSISACVIVLGVAVGAVLGVSDSKASKSKERFLHPLTSALSRLDGALTDFSLSKMLAFSLCDALLDLVRLEDVNKPTTETANKGKRSRDDNGILSMQEVDEVLSAVLLVPLAKKEINEVPEFAAEKLLEFLNSRQGSEQAAIDTVSRILATAVGVFETVIKKKKGNNGKSVNAKKSDALVNDKVLDNVIGLTENLVSRFCNQMVKLADSNGNSETQKSVLDAPSPMLSSLRFQWVDTWERYLSANSSAKLNEVFALISPTHMQMWVQIAHQKRLISADQMSQGGEVKAQIIDKKGLRNFASAVEDEENEIKGAVPVSGSVAEASLEITTALIVEALALADMFAANGDVAASVRTLSDAIKRIYCEPKSSTEIRFSTEIWRLFAALYIILTRLGCQNYQENREESKLRGSRSAFSSESDSDEEDKPKKVLQNRSVVSSSGASNAPDIHRRKVSSLLDSVMSFVSESNDGSLICAHHARDLLATFFKESVRVVVGTVSHAALGETHGLAAGTSDINRQRYERMQGLLVLVCLAISSEAQFSGLTIGREEFVHGPGQVVFSRNATLLGLVLRHFIHSITAAARSLSSNSLTNFVQALDEIRAYILPTMRTSATTCDALNVAAGICIPVPRALLRSVLIPAYVATCIAFKTLKIRRAATEGTLRNLTNQLISLYNEDDSGLGGRAVIPRGLAGAASVRNEAFQSFFLATSDSYSSVSALMAERNSTSVSEQQKGLEIVAAPVETKSVTATDLRDYQVDDWLLCVEVEEKITGDLLHSVATLRRGLGIVENPQRLLVLSQETKRLN